MKPAPVTILDEICKQQGIPPAMIVSVARANRETKKARVLFVRACRAAGWGYYHIARVLNVSISTAHRYGFYYEL